jgi:hypothetical protein
MTAVYYENHTKPKIHSFRNMLDIILETQLYIHRVFIYHLTLQNVYNIFVIEPSCTKLP